MLGFRILRIGLLLRIGHDRIPLLRHTDADEKDITLLEGDIAFFRDLQDIGELNLVPGERGVRDPPALRPGGVVN